MAFTSALHLSLFWDRSVQSCPHTSHFLIDLNIILPYMPGSSKWSLSLRFPHQNPSIPLLSPHTCYMPCLWHSFGFDHPYNIWWGVQIIKLLIIWFFPLPFYLIPFRLHYAPSASVLKHHQLTLFPQFEWPSLKHQYKTTGKIIVLYILVFVFWIAVWMTKVSGPTSICF